jgi:hypothetical protein
MKPNPKAYRSKISNIKNKSMIVIVTMILIIMMLRIMQIYRKNARY